MGKVESNMTTTEYEQCSERVWSDGSWGSHQCTRKGKVQREGKWYCGQHDPDKVAARKAKKEAEWQAERNRNANQQAKSERLIKRLGVGSVGYSAIGGIYTGGVTLSAAEAEALAERLERAENR